MMNLWDANAPQRERTFRRQHALYDRLLDLLFADKILGNIRIDGAKSGTKGLHQRR